MINTTVNETAASAVLLVHRPRQTATLIAGAMLVATVVIIAVGLRAHSSSGLPNVHAVAFGLALAWAVAGLGDSRESARAADQPIATHLIIAIDALAAAVALSA
jgi:hypothetical protein